MPSLLSDRDFQPRSGVAGMNETKFGLIAPTWFQVAARYFRPLNIDHATPAL
jgi:hypothetical protein